MYLIGILEYVSLAVTFMITVGSSRLSWVRTKLHLRAIPGLPESHVPLPKCILHPDLGAWNNTQYSSSLTQNHRRFYIFEMQGSCCVS
jgi:hypothetical protein